MTSVLALAGGLSLAVKISWMILLIWAVGQVYWYHQARETVLPPMKPEGRSTRRRNEDGEFHSEGAPI